MPGSARDALRTIVVAGTGPVGLAAAIALRRALPSSMVTLVRTPDDPAALADSAATFLPQTNAFHDRLGIDEKGLILRCGASHRLALAFAGWTGPDHTTLQAYGAAPPDGVDPRANPAMAATLAAAERFAIAPDDPALPLSDIDHALRVNPEAYRNHLAALARHLGVVGGDRLLRAAVPDGKGGLAEVVLEDGTRIGGDLFVDGSGPAARLASALPLQDREDWSGQLPCDRVLVARQEDQFRLTTMDEVAAMTTGWRASSFGRDGCHAHFAFQSDCGPDEAAVGAAGFESGTLVAIAPGRRAQAWQANVLCLGDAAAQFEPLHWMNLSLAHAQMALFLEHLPGREDEPLERAEYNRRAGAMADRVRDFIALHYCAKHRPEGRFWAQVATLERSDSLALTLAEYSGRGRLPYFEDDMVSRDAWKLAMATIGLAPGMAPRIAALPVASQAALADQHKARVAAALRQAIPYPQWLAAYPKAFP
ncbi:MAG: tryptophan 7-halogenase [Novosphingobium sp.]|nr:tryptophan 7-halogenase [Novosphingobium sp.]